MDIQEEIITLKERNKRVEADKAWETSWMRKLLIAALTYIVATAWLLVIRESVPLLKALVPAAGYLLSTLTIGPVKRWWLATRRT